MKVEDYKKNVYENSDFKPEVEEHEKHPDETTIEFVDLRKPPEFKFGNYSKKLAVNFVKAFGFKILFKIARSLDKSRYSRPFNLDKLTEIVLNFSNVKYGFFIVLIKLFFKLFREVLYYLKLQDVVEYKRLNFLFGLLTNFVLIPLGKESTLTFYTCLFFLIKSLISFSKKHIYGARKRTYSESKDIYFMGVTLGFIIVSLTIPEYRSEISLIKYFLRDD